jgi:uncharacterized phage protein (TIGR01671 family)
MEREIKFRLWHKETGAFLKVWPYNWQNGVYTNGKPNRYFDNKFQFSEDNNECNRIEGKSCFLTIDGAVIGILPIDNLTHKSLDYSDEYIISQFIGLVDTKDNDIYEGDIIKTTGYIGIVKYEPQAAQYQIKWKDNANRYMPFNVTFSDGDTWKCDYMEVIGNIYENPELLNN